MSDNKTAAEFAAEVHKVWAPVRQSYAEWLSEVHQLWNTQFFTKESVTQDVLDRSEQGGDEDPWLTFQSVLCTVMSQKYPRFGLLMNPDEHGRSVLDGFIMDLDEPGDWYIKAETHPETGITWVGLFSEDKDPYDPWAGRMWNIPFHFEVKFSQFGYQVLGAWSNGYKGEEEWEVWGEPEYSGYQFP